MARNELQNIGDGAALAGGRELGRVYEGLTYSEQQTYILTTGDRQQIVNTINTVSQQNEAGSIPITISDADVLIGQWDLTTRSLTVLTNQPTAVQVTARRDGTANGPISTFLAVVLGMQSIEVSAVATAALSPVSSATPGELDLPVGISKKWFDAGNSCPTGIKFHPTGTMEGCAGWHTFTDTPANASTLRTTIQGLEAGTYESPETILGQTAFAFTGGTVASAFNDLQSLYNAKKDPITGEWKTFVVVYEQEDCSNPNGLITIVGFATGVVTAVNGSPNQEIVARVECDTIETGRGGGGGFGTLGSVPLLVS